MTAATYHLNAQTKKLGNKNIEKARPFYDVLRELRKVGRSEFITWLYKEGQTQLAERKNWTHKDKQYLQGYLFFPWRDLNIQLKKENIRGLYQINYNQEMLYVISEEHSEKFDKRFLSFFSKSNKQHVCLKSWFKTKISLIVANILLRGDFKVNFVNQLDVWKN